WFWRRRSSCPPQEGGTNWQSVPRYLACTPLRRWDGLAIRPPVSRPKSRPASGWPCGYLGAAVCSAFVLQGPALPTTARHTVSGCRAVLENLYVAGLGGTGNLTST